MLDLKNTSLVTTQPSFLSFGHGRHACPGRFFAAQEMKLMLAYMVRFYDVERLEKRPPNWQILGLSVPDERPVIKVRRRESTA